MSFIDFVQHRMILRSHESAEMAGIQARSAQDAVARLEAEVGRLTLACTAMWSLLRDRAGVTDVDLLAAIQEIDLRDGEIDGRHRPAGVECPECGRVSNRRHRFCMYCEAALPRQAMP